MDVEVGVMTPNVSQYRYPVFMLIDLFAMTEMCFPGLAKILEPEGIHSCYVFDNQERYIWDDKRNLYLL